ncbi:MAG: T9SS type A sorting domain-containing protein, partial [Bacteroidia bacterium]
VIFTGDINSMVNSNDYFYAKTDSLGNFIYGNIYNGFTNSWDESGDIITDANNYAVVAGSTISTLTGYDGVLIKYDAGGNEQFFLTYDGADHLNDKFIAIDTTSSGQYYAAGYSKSNATANDMWVIKADQNGTVLWNKLLTGSANGEDMATDVQTDNFNNAYVSGFQTNNGTGKDASIVKLNSSGNVLWSKKYSGPGSNPDAFLCFTRTIGGGPLYAAGFTTNSAGNKDVLLCCYTTAGNLSWSAIYDTPLHGNDSAIAVTVDASNNVYITGKSDSLNVFTIKFSNTGSLSWVKPEPTMANVGPGICVNANGQVYISCRMDTLTYDLLKVICYDNNGNTQWSRNFSHSCCEEPAKLRKTSRGTVLALFDAYTTVSIAEFDTIGTVLNHVTYYPGYGLNNIGGANAITIDKNDDVYFTSWFTIDAGTDIVTGKLCYTPGASAISGTDSVCYGTNSSYAISPVTGVTQYSWASPSGSSIVSGTNTNAINVDFGTSSNGYIIVTKTNYCGTDDGDTLMVNVLPLPVVNAGADMTVCPGTTITLSGSGAQTYAWNNGISDGTPFSATTGQAYMVMGTDNNNCSNSDTVLISLTVPPPAELCLVTVDSLSTHNILAWDKTSLTGVAYFNIYREDITNNYTLIAAVPYDSLSEYHDMDPTANPNVTTKRYKISAVDTCGNEGLKSGFHNTIFVNNNSGSFTWNTYTIQNQPNPVQFYALYRDDLSNGNWVQVGTTAGTQNVLNDANYSSYPNGSWRIETIWNISCTPTRGAINTSRSNIKVNSVTGIQSLQSIAARIYPNPFANQLTIELPSDRTSGYLLEITNALGQVITAAPVNNSRIILSTETWASGVYFYKLYNNNSVKAGKIIKE